VKVVIIIVVVITTAEFLRPLANCLPEISEPISDFSNIPAKTLEISADLSGVQEKLKNHIHSNLKGERRTFFNCGRGSSFVQLL
jgi:hypothetical protein